MANREWPVVMCPGCRVPMGVKTVTVEPGRESGDVLYACDICKTETLRLFNRQPAPRSGAA